MVQCPPAYVPEYSTWRRSPWEQLCSRSGAPVETAGHAPSDQTRRTRPPSVSSGAADGTPTAAVLEPTSGSSEQPPTSGRRGGWGGGRAGSRPRDPRLTGLAGGRPAANLTTILGTGPAAAYHRCRRRHGKPVKGPDNWGGSHWFLSVGLSCTKLVRGFPVMSCGQRERRAKLPDIKQGESALNEIFSSVNRK